MNVLLNGRQSDTRKDDITLLSNSNLTGDENLLLKIVNSGGVAKFDLPANINDEAFYVCMSGGAAGAETAAEAPGLGENCRVAVSGACNPGDKLGLDPNNWGKLYVPGAGAGAGFYLFMAEETGVAGQDCLVRRIPDRSFNL
jgi:hypothetical protein